MVKGIFPDWGWAWTQVLGFLSAVNPASKAMDTSWYAPNATAINDLDRVLNSEGVYGFIFNSSHTPDEEYGQYNWCNMPHVRRTEYKKAPDDYKLQYVEVVSYIILLTVLPVPCKGLTQRRFIDTINGLHTRATCFLTRQAHGNAPGNARKTVSLLP